MQVTREQVNPTTVKLTIVPGPSELEEVKEHVLRDFNRSRVRVPGFRSGKAPLALVEKNADPNALQSEFIDHALNTFYGRALDEEHVRAVAQPEVTINKFVPFTVFEFTAQVEAIGTVKLTDYKKIRIAKKPVTVTAKDVDEVIENLLSRSAERTEVARAAKSGDQVLIDFAGNDAKTKEAIAGADGKEYPLVLGSDSFIPGFETNVVGMKVGEEKSFDLTFPKDYGVKALQNRKVTFTVTVHKVEELKKPKLDDAFAASVGPFKTVAELKADVKKQIETEQAQQHQRAYDEELILAIADKSSVDIPEVLIDKEIDRMENQERQNLLYRGQTWEEHLKEEGVDAAEHRKQNHEAAERNVKAGLVLAEVADKEGISVSREELEMRIKLLKGQYQDKQMQTELDKPENRQDIMSRMLSDKTLAKLNEYASAK